MNKDIIIIISNGKTPVSLTQKTGWNPMGCCRNSFDECIQRNNTTTPEVQIKNTVIGIKIYTLDKVQNQALPFFTRSIKSIPIKVMEETTAIQPLRKRRDMKNIIQSEKYKCLPFLNNPMRKTVDDMIKHRIKRESFIHKKQT